MINFSDIDPIAISFKGFAIRWYSIAYMVGILGGWLLLKHNSKLKPEAFKNKNQLDDLVTWVTIGVILGGRIGYILFYNLSFYINNVSEIFKLWHGGMSFHGGFLGVTLALFLYSKKNKLKLFNNYRSLCNGYWSGLNVW